MPAGHWRDFHRYHLHASMRQLLQVLALCLFWYSVQTLEFSTSNNEIQSYELSPQELKAVLQSRQLQKSLTTSSIQSSVLKRTLPLINTEIMCTEMDNRDEEGWDWKFKFIEARCKPTKGDLRKFTVTCSSLYATPHARQTWRPSQDVDTSDVCPEEYVCQNWDRETMDFKKIRDIECVHQSEVSTKVVTVGKVIHDTRSKKSSTTQNYCTNPENVPESSDYGARVPWKGVNLVVTEEVYWPNLTEYQAPALYIHDKSKSLFEFDRVLERNAHVASAEIVLQPIGPSRIQQKQLQFCIDLLQGNQEIWIILMYSWWHATGRQGRVPEGISTELGDT